ncbi:MAG TPA: four helix bundle protein [Saprospiraceae bacterium]
MNRFRFEDLEIWQEAIEITTLLFRIADKLEAKKLWRFADQVRGVALSIPNNISESTGTEMLGEQTQLLRYSRRECYEAANLVVILASEKHITYTEKEKLYERLHVLSKRITSYSRSLK